LLLQPFWPKIAQDGRFWISRILRVEPNFQKTKTKGKTGNLYPNQDKETQLKGIVIWKYFNWRIY